MDKRLLIIINLFAITFLLFLILIGQKFLSIIVALSTLVFNIFFFHNNFLKYSLDLRNSIIPAVILDKNGIVRYQNKAHRSLFEYKDESIIGKKDPTISEDIINSIITREKDGIDLWVKTKNKKGENLDVVLFHFNIDERYIVLKIPIGKNSPIISKLIETEKLASLGSIATGLAHQLNTPLGTILLTAQMTKEEKNLKEIRENIEIIESQVKLCQEIVRKILLLSKPSEEEETEFNLIDVINEAAKIFEKVFQKKNIKFKILKENKKDIIIYGKRSEIEQVFINLFSNSVDAIDGEGEIKVHTFLTPFERVIIKVQDTGKGISPENADKIFEPFFTTKPAFKGTGLGLSIVKRIVESHGGVIKLINEGKGATFAIILPLRKNG
ncbi:MAG: ATP-binding protein [Candidatus Hydrothermales bacterium]